MLYFTLVFWSTHLGNLTVNAVVAVAYVLKTLYKRSKHFPSTGKKRSGEITLLVKGSRGTKFIVPDSNYATIWSLLLGFWVGFCFGGLVVVVWFRFLGGWVCVSFCCFVLCLLGFFYSVHELTFFSCFTDSNSVQYLRFNFRFLLLTCKNEKSFNCGNPLLWSLSSTARCTLIRKLSHAETQNTRVAHASPASATKC